MVQLAKLSRPALTRVLARHRLFQLLDEARARSAIWVAGPPGCGKTTLVASYLDERHLRCLWYQIDSGDRDVATFFHYLALGVEELAPAAPRLPPLSPEYLGAVGAFARRWFRGLWSHVDRPFALVFDNLQELPLSSALHVALREALDEVPPGVVVILVSRELPPPTLARLQLNGVIAHVSADDLRLTFDEARGIAGLCDGRLHGSIEEMHELSDGWVAGLVLLVTAGRAARRGAASRRAASQALFDYFAGEVFDGADPTARRVLVETAHLPEVTAEMAEGITGSAMAGDVLDDLARRGYFTTRHDGPKPSFRYHPLFREFLLAREREILTVERRRDVRREGARLLEQHGNVDAALELLVEISRWDDVARLALQHAPAMLAAGRVGTLQRWLTQLPGEVLEREPCLLHVLGLSTFPFDPAEGRGLLTRAFELAQRSGDAATLYTFWAAIAATYMFCWDTLHPLDRWIAEWDELRRRFPAFPSPDVEARAVTAIFGLLAFRSPDHHELPALSERCMELARTAPLAQRVGAAFAMVLHLMWSGRHDQGREVVDALGPAAAGVKDPMIAMMSCFIEATDRFVLRGDPAAAQPHYDRATELALENCFGAYTLLACANASLCACAAGDLKAAERRLRQARRVLRPSQRLEMSLYHCAAAYLALRQGDRRLSVQTATLATDLGRQAGAHFAEIVCGFLLVVALIEVGDLDGAASRVAEVRGVGSRVGSDLAAYLCSLAEALLALRRGAVRDALGPLRNAMAIGAARGIVYFGPLRASDFAELCAVALRHGIGVEHVHELIRRHDLAPPGDAALLESWPHGVHVRTLGRFDVMLHGEPLRPARKAPRRVLELLQVLVALGGEDVREGEVADALWPEADGDSARHALDTTLHRLRLLLGTNSAISCHDRALTVDRRRCWVDAWTLDRRLADATAALERGDPLDPDVTVEQARAIVALYGGPFLRDQEAPWATARRAALRRRLRRYLELLDHRAGALGHGVEAAGWRARCFELDPDLRGSVPGPIG